MEKLLAKASVHQTPRDSGAEPSQASRETGVGVGSVCSKVGFMLHISRSTMREEGRLVKGSTLPLASRVARPVTTMNTPALSPHLWGQLAVTGWDSYASAYPPSHPGDAEVTFFDSRGRELNEVAARLLQ